jgi:hypothetical protein
LQITGGNEMNLYSITKVEEAVKEPMAYGGIIQVGQETFITTLAKIEAPLVVKSRTKIYFKNSYQYLTSYKGLFFYVESKEPLELPNAVELMEVERMFIPRI